MKKNTILITKVVMLIVFVGIVIFDSIMAANKTKGDTISEITLLTSIRIVFIPYALGFLCGHLFWPSAKRYVPVWISLPVGVGLGILINKIILSLGCTIMPIWFVLVGVPFGFLLWPQKKEIDNE